ncbi:MAG TPA: glycosyltransferase [Terriglobales bacterium]|nr:glycosyltransferase [Terriglobales bacterium]
MEKLRAIDTPVETRLAASPPSRVRLFLMTNSFETGGSERQFAVLAKNLGPEQFQVHLGCIQRIGSFANDFGEVPEFRLGGNLYGWASWRTRLRLSRCLRQQHIQIAHAFDFYTNLTLIPAARFARVPVVIGSQRQIGDLLTPRQFRAQAAAFRWCDAVVCNSRAAADRLAAEGMSRDKLVVIGNALPAEAFAPAPAALPKRPGSLRVGMVARMNHRYKNHSGFMRIARRIQQQMPNVEFLLAGDGPLRAELEREAQTLGIGDRVVFLGDRRDIPAVMASLDVAVLTSDSESLSNVILEAMAAGLPVVAYRVGGNAELIDEKRGDEKRGQLISAGDEEGFAAAVERLLSAPSIRAQFGHNARKFAEENFGLENVRARYEACYQTLLEKKGVRTPLGTWRPTTEAQRNG